ncbi:MAG: hypothetical protein WCJ81_06615 [bacterium]
MKTNNDLFIANAKPLEAQLPFIRAYKHIDNVFPYIVNENKDQESYDDLIDTIAAHHGEKACFVIIKNEEETTEK